VSPGDSSRGATRRALANRENVPAQRLQLSPVRFAPRPNGNVRRAVGAAGAERRQQLEPSELLQTSLESIAVDGGVLVARHDDPDTRNAERGSEDPDIEIRGPNSLPLSNDGLNVEAPREPMATRKTEAVVTRLRTCLAV
jgi:hypothetical protein